MFNEDAVLVKKDDNKRYKILSKREIWIDLYSLSDGEIITLEAVILRNKFFVYIDPAFQEATGVTE